MSLMDSFVAWKRRREYQSNIERNKENTYMFDFQLNNWCMADKNAKFISLKEVFGTGFGKLFPSCSWSSDGVHFNPRGGARFTSLIEGAMVK